MLYIIGGRYSSSISIDKHKLDYSQAAVIVDRYCEVFYAVVVASSTIVKFASKWKLRVFSVEPFLTHW